MPSIQWGLWALLIKAGPRKIDPKESIYRKTIFIPRWKPVRDMGVPEDKFLPEGTIQPKPKSPVKGPRRKEVVRNITVLDLFSGTGSVTKALSGVGAPHPPPTALGFLQRKEFLPLNLVQRQRGDPIPTIP